jgi:hypothetical protein
LAERRSLALARGHGGLRRKKVRWRKLLIIAKSRGP